MKKTMFTMENVLWGTSEAEFEKFQKELDQLIPGAKAVVLPEEILNYEPSEEELRMLGLSTNNEIFLPFTGCNEDEFIFKKMNEDVANQIGIVLKSNVLNEKKYKRLFENKAA